MGRLQLYILIGLILLVTKLDISNNHVRKHGIHGRKERNIEKLFVLMEIGYYNMMKLSHLWGGYNYIY
jgi:hypothetical protein